ncbi:MAG: hypothetical protein E7358_05100 [Clostridiales bacterium]|nr:hypothetical protein [Clostridiales bacterium]
MFKRAKFYLIIFAIIFINFLTLDFLLIDVEKTALIVAIGIDKTESGYEVTAQIAVPEATNQSTKSNESVIFAKGKTLYDAVDDIGSRTGWYPKLSFCNLIILGNSVFEENVMGVIDFFVRSYKVEDSAILCASEKSAKEVLLSVSPLDNISSFALSKIFVRDHSNASPVLTTTIKDFSILYYSHCKSGYMPLVKMIDTEDKGNNTSQTSSLTNNSGAPSGEDKNTPVVYDAETCLLFSNGIKTGEIQGDECLFFSLFDKNVNESYFNLEVKDDDGNFGKALIALKKSRASINLEFENQTPVLKGELKIWLQIIDTDFPQEMKEIATIGRLNEQMLKKAGDYVTFTLEKLFETTKNLNCDLFETQNMLYRFHNKKFNDYTKDLLKNLKCNFIVTCQNYI